MAYGLEMEVAGQTRESHVAAIGYRGRVLASLLEALDDRTFSNALDFGAGDGWFATQMLSAGVASNIVAVDVKERAERHFPVRLYDGQHLPFPDRSFPLVYAVDVIHHCPDPELTLADILRVCGDFFLIKDHTYKTTAEKLTIAVMDEIGNRRFGIPSIYNYQERFAWSKVMERSGFKLQAMQYPSKPHVGLLGALTNKLQFVALWRRV